MFLRENKEPELTDVADLERGDGFSLSTLSLKVKCPPRGVVLHVSVHVLHVHVLHASVHVVLESKTGWEVSFLVTSQKKVD